MSIFHFLFILIVIIFIIVIIAIFYFYYIEGFDIKSDNSLAKLVGGLEVTGDVTYKDNKSLETQIASLQNQINSILNGSATISSLNVTGEISAKKVTSRDGEIAIGSGDNGWQIRAQGVGGTPERWLEFWNNQEGAPRSHGRVLFNKFGNMWNQHQDVWSNTVKSTADSANSKVDSILNGSATIKGNITLTGDIVTDGNLYARGGHIILGSGNNRWWLRTTGHGGADERWLEFWNETNAGHQWNGNGTIRFRPSGNIWCQTTPSYWFHDLLQILTGEKQVALENTGGSHGNYRNIGLQWLHTQDNGYIRQWDKNTRGYYSLRM